MSLEGLDLGISRRAVGPPSHYLLPWKEQSLGYQGVDAEVGVMSKATSQGRRVRRGRLVKSKGYERG